MDTSFPVLETFDLGHRLACCCRRLSSACDGNRPEGAFFWFFTSDESVPTSDESGSESCDCSNNEHRNLNFCSTYQEIQNAAMRHFYVDHPLEFLHNVGTTLDTLKKDIYPREESFGFPGASVVVSVRPLGFSTQDKSDWVDGVPVHFRCIPAMEISCQTNCRIYRRKWIALVAGYIRTPMLLTLIQATVAQRLYVQGIERNRFVMSVDGVSVYGDWWKHVFTWAKGHRLFLHK